MGVRQDKNAANRKEILRVSTEIFAEKGFAAASVSEIIRRAKLSRATFYLHYQNKEEIFGELTSRVFRQMLVDMNRARRLSKDFAANPRQAIKELARSVFATFEKQQGLIRIFMSTGENIEPKFDAQLKRYLEGFIGAIESLAREYHERGIVNFPNHKLLAWVIYGSLREIWHQSRVLRHDSADIEQYLEEITALLFDGIGHEH